MKINYVIGDATQPQGTGNKIIVHVCNDIGAWGAGFVLAISKRWSEPEAAYRKAASRGLTLGEVQYVRVEDDIFVGNMVAQQGIGYDSDGRPPIRYYELSKCLMDVNTMALASKSTVHMPRIGCGLAGGKWEDVLALLEITLTVDVTVYDLK